MGHSDWRHRWAGTDLDSGQEDLQYVQKAWSNQVSEGCGNVARCVQCGGVCENKFLTEVSGEYPAK